MTAELEEGEESKVKETNFKCKFCEKSKPLNEMVLLSRYFPPVVTCRDCSKKIR